MPSIPTVFLTSISNAHVNISNLAHYCKMSMLSYLYLRIADEELRPRENKKTFIAKRGNWLLIPEPKIITVSTLGVETLRYLTTNYTLNDTEGSITFLSATDDTVRASYYCWPISDIQLVDLAKKSFNEISTLIFRQIDENNIHPDYQVAICKRLYTNILRVLLLEARDYFSVSVGGRVISKTNVVPQISQIIIEHEKVLAEELSILRSFNKTNRMLPVFPTEQTLKSNTVIE